MDFVILLEDGAKVLQEDGVFFVLLEVEEIVVPPKPTAIDYFGGITQKRYLEVQREEEEIGLLVQVILKVLD